MYIVNKLYYIIFIIIYYNYIIINLVLNNQLLSYSRYNLSELWMTVKTHAFCLLLAVNYNAKFDQARVS